MLKWLHRPLPYETTTLVALGLVAATALYCFSYNALAGQAESPVEGVLWALENVLPWWLAFEAAKRAPTIVNLAAICGAALASSLLLHTLIYDDIAFGFELVRRLPALALVAVALAVGHLLFRKTAGGNDEWEFSALPDRIDWVAAAGNYVELHGAGRPIIRRASMASLEASLARKGFVRIHRSILVRRDRIARVRRDDVILHDGTSLRIGKRYRSALAG